MPTPDLPVSPAAFSLLPGSRSEAQSKGRKGRAALRLPSAPTTIQNREQQLTAGSQTLSLWERGNALRPQLRVDSCDDS